MLADEVLKHLPYNLCSVLLQNPSEMTDDFTPQEHAASDHGVNSYRSRSAMQLQIAHRSVLREAASSLQMEHEKIIISFQEKKLGCSLQLGNNQTCAQASHRC